MKRLLNILLLFTLAWSVQAQDLMPTVKNVSYIYRNDDHFNGFVDSEVDSITFSRIDADGFEHVDYVTQIVYTPDSIYHIPLAAIDSVKCEQPRIELQKDVVMLTQEQIGFVLSADSTSILFRSDTPRSLLPNRGEVLVAMGTESGQSIQFAGRVVRTVYTADGVLVTCDPELQLSDIFRRFTAVMLASPDKDSGDAPEEWDVPHSGNREKFDPFSKNFVWEPKSLSFKDPSTGKTITYTPNYVSGKKKTLGPYSKNLLELIPEGKRPDWLDTDKYSLGLKDVYFDFNYRQKFLIDFFYDKDDWVIPSLYFYWRPTLLPVIRGKLNLKIDGQFEKELTFLPDIPPIPIFTPPVPPAIPPIKVGEVNFHITPLYIRFGGETDISYKFKLQKIVDVEVEHNTSGIHVTDMAKKANGGYEDKSGLYPEGFEFASSDMGEDIDHIGSVFLWFAWNPSVGVSLITEKVLTAALDFKIGPWFQLNIEKTKQEPDDQYTRFYQKWSPTHLLTKGHGEIDFYVILAKGTKAQKKFSLAEKLKDWNFIGDNGFDFWERRYGIFPGFGEPTLSSNWRKNLDQRGVVSFTTAYKNPNHGAVKYDKLTRTFLSANLGVGLYRVNENGQQEEVATSFSPKKEKGWFSSEEGTYTTEFKNVKRGYYIVAPIFDAPFFDPLRAIPQVTVVVPPTVVTEDVTDVGQHHCYMNGYAIGLKSFTVGDYEGKLGWIVRKAEENGSTVQNLTFANVDSIPTITISQAKSETVNGEGKLSFGKSHSSAQSMLKLTRCDKLRPGTTYIYRAWATYPTGSSSEEVIYGDIKEFTTDLSDDDPKCVTDLGLSVDWACWNVGAVREYQYGNYYAWGEKETKKEYTAANYKLPAKHNFAGDPDYDVALTWNNKANSGWRMPTKAEIQELIDNCDMEWVTVHKVQGMKFTSRKNGNSIFFPAAGNKYGKKIYSQGIGGCYWSADLDPESLMDEIQNAITPSIEQEEEEEEGKIGIGEGDAKELTVEERADAWRLHFNNVEEEGKAPHNEAGRCYYGRTVRPVKVKEVALP